MRKTATELQFVRNLNALLIDTVATNPERHAATG